MAISCGGVMFFADLVAGFTTIRRALQPGGRLAFLGPRPLGPDGELARATSVLAPYLCEPSSAANGMMSLVDPDRIRQVVTEAGFTEVDVRPVEATETLGRNAADAATFVIGMPMYAHNLRAAEPSTRDRLRAELADGLRPYETGAGVQTRGAVWLATAVRA